MKKFLLMCFSFVFVLSVWAQDRIVSGRVTSQEDGAPLPGVNVVLKGTSNGTVTDTQGNYKINVPTAGGTLSFSFIGLVTREIEITTQSTADIVLTNDVKQLSEVVVSALGIEQNKDELGTATSRVVGGSISKSGEATLINGLSAKASGVNIVRTTGDPGAGSYIQIRGQNTITGNLQPLIILDGVPIYNSNAGSNLGTPVVTGNTSTGNDVGGVAQQSRLNDINPDDIQSIEVLKGASAGALWGTRAANGVIVITTKKGSSAKGKVNVSLKYTRSMDKLYITHDLTNNWGSGVGMMYQNISPTGARPINGPTAGLSWGDYIPERTGGADVQITDPNDPDYVGYFEAADGTRFYRVPNGTPSNPHGGKNSQDTYDYRKDFFKTGYFNDVGVTLNGGDKDGNFFISFDNLSQEGVIKKNSSYDRTTLRVNANKKLSDLVRVGTNFGYTKTKSNRAQQGSNISGLYLGGLRTSPDFNSNYFTGTYVDVNGIPHFNRQRGYRNPLGGQSNSVYDNPLWTMDHNISTTDVDRFIGSVEAGIAPIKWLDVTARLGVDSYTDRRYDFYEPQSATSPFGSLILQTIRETQYNADIFGQSKFKLTDDLDFSALLGMNFNQRTFENVGGNTQIFIVDQSVPLDLNNASPANKAPFNYYILQRTAAAYSTMDFAFKNQLFLNLTGRAESASTFGRATQSTFFYPAANLAWQFTQMLSQSKALSFGKLRTSFGQVGVQPTPYNTATYYVAGGFADGWGSGLQSAGYGNGGYVENTILGNSLLKPEKKTEIEFGTDLRFFEDRFSLSATYFTNKTNDAILSISTAPSTGFTSKTGNAAEIKNHGLEFDFGAEILRSNNFSWKLNGNWSMYRNKVTNLAGTTSLLLAGFQGTSSRAVQGHPLGVIWGTDWLKDTEGNLILDEHGFPQQNPNESVIADPNPEWRAALGNTFSFKGLSLYVLLERTQGGDIWAGTHGIMNHFGRSKDADMRTTVSEAEADAILIADGSPISDNYPQNSDGTYTFRGSLTDYGAGTVALDQTWYTGLGGGFGPVASQFIKKATNTRIREITLSYSLNSPGFRAATKLSSIDFSLTGRNLLVVGPDIKYIGNDPETNLTGASNGRGIEYFNNPSTRSYLFTIKINY
jgi:TonB-linked SusC/RagA family outer membrane protein